MADELREVASFYRDRIDSSQKELSVAMKLLDMREQLEQHRAEILERLEITKDPDEAKKLSAEFEVVNEKLKQVKEEIQINCDQSMLESEATRGLGQHFHKDICLANIRMLLKKTKTQLGGMEKEAGVSTGYMSRLEKEGNTNDPSIEFVVTAADTFGVTVDDLIREPLPEISPTEEYVLGFLRELKSATRNDEINWAEETIKDLKNAEDAYLLGDLSHPLFQVYGEEAAEGEAYYSSFYGALKVQPFDSGYHAHLPGTNDSVYIEKVIFSESAKDEQPAFFYEVYLVSYDEAGPHASPVCCTAKMSTVISTAVENLYEEIEAGMKRVHISDDAKFSIAQFMNRKNPIIRAKEESE